MDSPQDDSERPISGHPAADTGPGRDGAQPTDGSGALQGTFDDHQDASLDAQALQQLLLTTHTVQDFLDQLVQRAAADTGHHCGITVGPPDAQHDVYTVTSSDELSRQLDELQYAEGNGPCLEALRTSVPVFVTDMTSETRWPDYLSRAVEMGARSSLSYPLRSGETTIGAINFYAFEPMAPQVDL